MTDKSYVSVGQHICPICGTTFDSNEVLIDKRLRNSLESKTVTDYGLCPEHRKLADEGYIALVECDPNKTTLNAQGNVESIASAYRTGKIAHLRKSVWPNIFAGPAPDLDFVYVEPGVIEKLQAMAPKEQDDGDQSNPG